MMLDKRVAVVTGASKGIGLATAEAFAAQGAQVLMLARDKDSLESRAAQINATSGAPTVVAIIAAAVSVQGTERSIWPSRITIIMPAATTPRKAPVWSCCRR